MDRSTELQIELLGNYMHNSDLFANVIHLVRPNIFTTSTTKKSFELIKKYHEKNIQLDVGLLWRELHQLGIPQSEASVIVSYNSVSRLSEEHIEEYVKELFANYAGEYISKSAQGFISRRESSDPIKEMLVLKDTITNVELALNGVNKGRGVRSQFREAIQRIKDIKDGAVKQTGFSWGIPSLDKRTLGIVQGINIVAAAKGGGKTSCVINVIVENVINRQLPMLFFSMEMPAVEVLTNVMSNVVKLNSESLRRGVVLDEDVASLEAIESKLNEPKFVIDETGGITYQYFEAQVRAFRKNNKIPYSETILVALDYLGLMQNVAEESRMSKEEKIEQICNQLMRICKNENIALLKLAQFSREIDKRGSDTFRIKDLADKLNALRPKMSDLKGSAAIESNAVKIILLYRPEYYDIFDCDGVDFRGKCELIIAKDRYGRPGKMLVGFEGRYSLFKDLEPESTGIITTGEDKF